MYQQVNELLGALNQFDQIRYAAYRTAAKLRFIQRNTKIDCVKLTHVLNVVDKFGLRPTCERELLLTTEELRPVIQDIFSSAQKETLVQLSPKVSCKVVLELLTQTFDKNGHKGGCTLLDLFVFFAILCSETGLGEKYQKLLHLISDHNSCIQKRSLAILLKSISNLPHLVDEAPAFGNWTVLAAVQQCFQSSESPSSGLPEDAVFAWLAREPQSLVWVSTLYRINASSKVMHPVRCNVCDSQPIQGFRYQCLQCLSYNQCQQCFWLGLVSKGHKVTHQMQEYCAKTTSKEAGQALMKKIGNWLALKKKKTIPIRYLPLDKAAEESKSSSVWTIFDETTKFEPETIGDPTTEPESSGSSPGSSKSSRPELISVVGHLMEEKGKLECYIEQVGSSNSLGPVVKEHCDQLELQLRRLRQLVSEKSECVQSSMAVAGQKLEQVLPKFPRLLTRLESTPLLPNQLRKNELEQLNFSPIDEPTLHRSARERQSGRSTKASTIVTNGTLTYCTPRLGRKTDVSEQPPPRFATEFSLRDLSRNFQQPHETSGASALIKSTTVDSQLNAELEEILAQLEKMFPSSGDLAQERSHQENETLIRATNQVAGVLAEFVDGFKD